MAQYEVGHDSPGPGRPKGSKSGRSQALAVLDQIFAKAENKEKLEKDLQAQFDKNPSLFFRRYAMPLLPRDMLIKLDEIKIQNQDIIVEIVPPGDREEIPEGYEVIPDGDIPDDQRLGNRMLRKKE